MQQRQIEISRALASMADARKAFAVLAIPDTPESNDEYQDALLEALYRLRPRRSLLVWRSVLAVLAELKQGMSEEVRTVGVIGHSRSGLTTQKLKMRHGALSAPERRETGREYKCAFGLDALLEDARNQMGQEGPQRGTRGRATPPSDSINGGQSTQNTELYSTVGEQHEKREKTVSDAGVEVKSVEHYGANKGSNSTTLQGKKPLRGAERLHGRHPWFRGRQRGMDPGERLCSHIPCQITERPQTGHKPTNLQQLFNGILDHLIAADLMTRRPPWCRTVVRPCYCGGHL